MKYQEYINAYHRHYNTCLFLLDNLKVESDENKIDEVLAEVYYLSGIAIECILSYCVFYLIRYNEHKSVYELDNDNGCGLKFSVHFRTHKFDKKIEFLNRRGGVIPSKLPLIGVIDVDDTTKKLFESWTIKIRYDKNIVPIKLNKTDLFKYLSVIDLINKGLRKI